MFLGQVLPTSGPQHPASAVGSSRHRTEAGGMGLDGRVLAFMGKGRKGTGSCGLGKPQEATWFRVQK